MQSFPQKLIINMEMFISKLKFGSSVYQKYDYEHLVQIHDNDSVLRPICRKDRFFQDN